MKLLQANSVFIEQAAVLMASPVVSLTCTFGTYMNSEKAKVKGEKSNALCNFTFAFSLAAFIPSVQECDATKA